jgi:CNT family concentrative nucleoside transporter
MQDNQTRHDGTPPSAPAETSPTTNPSIGKTQLAWRLAIGAALALIAGVAYLAQDVIGLRGQSVAGILFFFGIVAMFSSNLRAVNWRTIGWGIAIQLILAVVVLKAKVTIGGTEYSVYAAIERMGDAVKRP